MSSSSNLASSKHLRLTKKKKTVIVIIGLIALLLSAAVAFGPPIYQESWLDPSSTLNVPNRDLHPRWINKLGFVNPDDPFHPHYSTSGKEIQVFVRGLQTATPLSPSEQTSFHSESQRVYYLTLHREASQYHDEKDFALLYYPETSVVYFGQEYFRITGDLLPVFSELVQNMSPGWWS